MCQLHTYKLARVDSGRKKSKYILIYFIPSLGTPSLKMRAITSAITLHRIAHNKLKAKQF